MEYRKRDWQRSDGRLKSTGHMEREKNRRLSAYRPSDRENTRERRPNEMLKMENSYGGISFGANRRKHMTMVVHEKRVPNGPVLRRDHKELEGNRTAQLMELRGNFKTNSHSRKDSALAYKETLEESPARMMERIQKMMDDKHQRSGEQMLPFMNRKEDQAESEAIRVGLQSSREHRDRSQYMAWSRRRDQYIKEQAEKAQMRRQFYRELRFVREKSRRLMREEDMLTLAAELMPGLQTEDGTEEQPEGGDANISRKEGKKNQNDYKNV